MLHLSLRVRQIVMHARRMAQSWTYYVSFTDLPSAILESTNHIQQSYFFMKTIS